MQKFWILWSYYGTSGKFECVAKDEDKAEEILLSTHSNAFRQLSTYHIFRDSQVMTVTRGIKHRF